MGSVGKVANYSKSYKDKFGITLVNSNSVDPKLLHDTDRVLSKLYEDSKLPLPKNLSVEFVSFSDKFKGTQYEDVWALSQRDFNGTIYLNSDKLSDYKKAEQQYSELRDSGNYVKNSTVANILLHEIGHKVEYNLAQMQGIPVADLSKHEISSLVVNNAFDSLPKGTFSSMQEARESISQYAAKNYTILFENDHSAYEETVAEAISDYYTNGRKSSIFSQRIVKELENLGRKG